MREAIADPELSRFVDAMVADEIAPALPELPVADYWRKARRRFANPLIDHRLDQIAEDGSPKLAERILPLMIANALAGRPTRPAHFGGARLARLGRWRREGPAGRAAGNVGDAGRDMAAALDDALLFPAQCRADPAVRRRLRETAA